PSWTGRPRAASSWRWPVSSDFRCGTSGSAKAWKTSRPSSPKPSSTRCWESHEKRGQATFFRKRQTIGGGQKSSLSPFLLVSGPELLRLVLPRGAVRRFGRDQRAATRDPIGD